MLNHIEIEHKYLLESEDEVSRLRKTVKALNPTRTFRVTSQDSYYTSSQLTKNQNVILRHRSDKKKSELTLKTYGGDTECRREVDLKLSEKNLEKISLFASLLGFSFAFSFVKKVQVFEFDDCEIALYFANYVGLSTIICFEIEAKNQLTKAKSVAVLKKYAKILKLDPGRRCQLSLFDLIKNAL